MPMDMFPMQTSVNIMAVRKMGTCVALVVFHIISIIQMVVRVHMTSKI